MISDVLTKLAATNSSIDKLNILIKYDNPELRKVLSYAYNPHYVYGIANLPVGHTLGRDSLSAEEETLLKNLAAGTLSGNKARAAIDHAVHLKGYLITYIINKDLRCGISATTINKAMPGLIPEFKVQLAKEVDLDKLKWPMQAEIKYDGVRLIATVSNKSVVFRTRNGKEVRLPKLYTCMTDLPSGVYDGEIIHSSGAQETRTLVSGMINSAMHGGIIDESKLRYVLFDTLSLEDFAAAKCNTHYTTRRQQLSAKLNNVAKDSLLAMTRSTLVYNKDDALAYYNSLLERGFEGVILKHATSLYTFKRSKDWVKLKQVIDSNNMKEVELTCVGYNEGRGKYEDGIGSLVCIGMAEGKSVQVNVAGLKEEHVFADFKSTFENKIIEVKYNTVIQDSKTLNYSLFLPRFNGVRFDK
ncbi:thermostable DNA ligasE [Caudoviricetes sp.]|nr:thermostable DNA ligasE [Caudoviricetes sp.]